LSVQAVQYIRDREGDGGIEKMVWIVQKEAETGKEEDYEARYRNDVRSKPGHS
jgi:hypothetical protein